MKTYIMTIMSFNYSVPSIIKIVANDRIEAIEKVFRNYDIWYPLIKDDNDDKDANIINLSYNIIEESLIDTI
jgi:hypothetical protein